MNNSNIIWPEEIIGQISAKINSLIENNLQEQDNSIDYDMGYQSALEELKSYLETLISEEKRPKLLTGRVENGFGRPINWFIKINLPKSQNQYLYGEKVKILILGKE